MAKETKQETFEQLYAKLEAAVAKLEEGGLPLEAAIAAYEEGMDLAKRCQDRLDAAELKITKLKESFAPLPERAPNGRVVNDAVDLPDYEYVSDGDAADPDDAFA